MTRVLALHGFTGAGADFDALRTRLPDAWQWQTPDLPGHGATRQPGSGVPGHSLEEHLQFLADHLPIRLNARNKTQLNAPTLDSTTNAQPPNPATNATPALLLGYSMGGRLALHLALRHPDAFSRLVLIGTSPGLADPAAREQRRLADESLARQIETAGLPAFFARWWESPLFTGLRHPRHDALRARRLRENTPSGLAASLRGVGTGTLPSLWNALPTLRHPVLCIAGAEDTKFTAIAREMAALLPNARVALVPDAHHLPHIERPATVAALLADFAAEAQGLRPARSRSNSPLASSAPSKNNTPEHLPTERHALIALGSNLGDRAAHLAAAVTALRALPGTRVLAVSNLRETKPVGYTAQPDFLNGVAAVATTLTPEEFLDACLRIEGERGRIRTIANGPRTLDLDLLFYEGETRATPRLTLPHPRWAERAFVCEPLAELLQTPALAAVLAWDKLQEDLRRRVR